MACTYVGRSGLIRGVQDLTGKPFTGFPKGRMRIRMRPNKFATAYVKTETGLRAFYIKEENGIISPYMETAANQAIKK
jgi:hypothetical protein